MNTQCQLCPKLCVIEPGQSGECRVRINIDGVLRTVVYNYPCSIHVDPIEKKPLFHFLPSTNILSIATVGCNLHCRNCQNWEMSQANPEDSRAIFCPPEKLIQLTGQYRCPSLAYTYTDPIIYYEYTYDTAKLAKQANIRNVLVTAGYVNEEPWKQLLQYVDAANIDLKAVSDDFYRQVCSATLKPVQKALVLARASGILVEVTNLIIPTLNDNLPPTSLKTLDLAREIAMSEGLNFVYIGNISSKEGQNTYCPDCKALLIERSGYTILQNRLKDGCCPDCGKEIYGVWK